MVAVNTLGIGREVYIILRPTFLFRKKISGIQLVVPENKGTVRSVFGQVVRHFTYAGEPSVEVNWNAEVGNDFGAAIVPYKAIQNMNMNPAVAIDESVVATPTSRTSFTSTTVADYSTRIDF
tara:strand:+ start:1254 stop:1619 length:366 start_codon:yes stop_codon:yes gene_type:complete